MMAKKDEIKAVVFMSSKPDNFIAGADIDMLQATEDKSKLTEMTAKAHEFFAEIKSSKIPFVAAINGACLGGGVSFTCLKYLIFVCVTSVFSSLL